MVLYKHEQVTLVLSMIDYLVLTNLVHIVIAEYSLAFYNINDHPDLQ